jgi:hypothetical protein
VSKSARAEAAKASRQARSSIGDSTCGPAASAAPAEKIANAIMVRATISARGPAAMLSAARSLAGGAVPYPMQRAN